MKRVRYTAGGGVVFAADRVLVLRRPARGEVRLPKGKPEGDETIEQTALREVREESGFGDLEIVADLGSQSIEFDHVDTDGSPMKVEREERYFLMLLTSPERVARPAEDEEDFIPDLVSADEALAELTYEAEREWVRRALQHQPARAGS